LTFAGSPNGQAAGYLLAQHKHRFGKSKTIEKVTVFRNEFVEWPYLLFHVIDTPPGPGGGDADGGEQDETGDVEMDEQNDMNVNATETHQGMNGLESRIVERSADGKNVIREHVIRARL